jgi:hypothetical protein
MIGGGVKTFGRAAASLMSAWISCTKSSPAGAEPLPPVGTATRTGFLQMKFSDRVAYYRDSHRM